MFETRLKIINKHLVIPFNKIVVNDKVYDLVEILDGLVKLSRNFTNED